MRPHPRRARTNPTSPRAWGTSDRNGMINNQENLCWQFGWRGTELINLRVLVSPDELDIPNRQLGTIILPPDPVSILNARPENYAIDEITYLLDQNGNQLYGQDGQELLGDNLQGAQNAGTYPG